MNPYACRTWSEIPSRVRQGLVKGRKYFHTLACRPVKRLIDAGVAGAADARQVIYDLTDWVLGFAIVNMLDAAGQFRHVSWWLVGSITVVPSAVATNHDAFEA
jgi:hypothetical protein